MAWVAWVRGSNFGVGDVVWRGWRGSREGVSGVGRVGLRCFVKKVLLKVSQNLQESTCAGVSC